MKKDVAIGIVLILLGGLGLASPPKFLNREVGPKAAQIMRIGSNATALSFASDLVNGNSTKRTFCTRDLHNRSAHLNLMEKVSMALANFDSVVTLQSIRSGS
jgi:hypothetical protein